MGDQKGFLPLPTGFATSAIHTAQDPEEGSSMAVVPPISMSSTFKQTEPAESNKYLYSRMGNPTRNMLEKVIAELECGQYGSCFSSGMGAVTTLLGLLKKGSHVVCIDDVYGGTNKLLSAAAKISGIETTFCGKDVANFEQAIQPNTKMIWIESPTNPTLQVCDIKGISKIAKKKNLIFVVDNTFLTPYFQRPLTLGADIVMHSISKYLNGHSDTVMGAAVTNDEKLFQEIKLLQSTMGIVPSPFDCYLVLRGLKTLAIRMKQHSLSSLIIAKHLEGHPKIEKVRHPALPSHPDHELTKKQTSGHSGVIAFYIKGDLNASQKFLQSLKLFIVSGSLGGCQSSIELPVLISHALVPPEQRQKLKITDNLVRMSVGLEDTEDLIADLDQALAVI